MALFARMASRARRRRRRLERQAAEEAEAAAEQPAESVEVVDSMHLLLSDNNQDAGGTIVLSPSALARKEYIRNVLIIKTVKNASERPNEEDDIDEKGDIFVQEDGQTSAQHQAHACCPICLVDYKVGDKICWSNNCRHQFHLDCMTGWLMQPRDECPCCRQNYISFGGDEDETEETHEETSEHVQEEEIDGGEVVEVVTDDIAEDIAEYEENDGMILAGGINALINALVTAQLHANLSYYQFQNPPPTRVEDERRPLTNELQSSSSYSAMFIDDSEGVDSSDENEADENVDECASFSGALEYLENDSGLSETCHSSEEERRNYDRDDEEEDIFGDGIDLDHHQSQQACPQRRPKSHGRRTNNLEDESRDIDADAQVNLGLGDLIVEGLMSRLEQQERRQQNSSQADGDENRSISSDSVYTNGGEDASPCHRVSCGVCGRMGDQLEWSHDPLCNHLFHRHCLGADCRACLREPDFLDTMDVASDEDEYNLVDDTGLAGLVEATIM